MCTAGSVTIWIQELRDGAPHAAERLWERYRRPMLDLARIKLRGSPKEMADEEDVVLSAFDSFFRGAEKGRFDEELDRGGLLRLLVVITARKAVDQRVYNQRQKRLPRIRPLSSSNGSGVATSLAPLDDLIGDTTTPEMIALMQENCARLLDRLEDPVLRQVALLRMEGYRNAEIAEQLNCVVRTVERKLRLIRSKWLEEPDE